MNLSLTELEAAINWWREQRPTQGNEHALSAEVSVLARVYALMIFYRKTSLDLASESVTVQSLIHVHLREKDLHPGGASSPDRPTA
jgi:hypothetical protein